MTPNNLLPPIMPFRWACAYGEDRIGLWQAFEVAGVRQVMRWIPPGEFLMGSPMEEAERSENEIQHRVVLTEGFWLANTACTQALWVAVMGENPSRHIDNLLNPVEQVSWQDITQYFLPKVNTILSDLNANLPTETEWEYACRAGTITPFCFGSEMTTDQINYDGNYPYADSKKGKYRGKTIQANALSTNSWGIHQMHGNVWEWCQDEYGSYSVDGIENPISNQADAENQRRVLRGGGWFSRGKNCRSALRHARESVVRLDSIGFRLARRAC